MSWAPNTLQSEDDTQLDGLPPESEMSQNSEYFYERIIREAASLLSAAGLTVHDRLLEPLRLVLVRQVQHMLLLGFFLFSLWLCRWEWMRRRRENLQAQYVADQIFTVLSDQRNHIAIQHLQTRFEQEGVNKRVWEIVVRLVERDSRVKRMQKRKGDMPITRTCWIWESDLDYAAKFVHSGPKITTSPG